MRALAPDDPVTRSLLALEPIFHRLPAGATPAMVAALVDPGFFEVGASGAAPPRECVAAGDAVAAA